MLYVENGILLNILLSPISSPVLVAISSLKNLVTFQSLLDTVTCVESINDIIVLFTYLLTTCMSFFEEMFVRVFTHCVERIILFLKKKKKIGSLLTLEI